MGIWGSGGPFADQGGLAEAGGRGDERQLALQPLIEPRDETRAGNGVGTRLRDIELGGEDGCGHDAIKQR